MRRSFFPYSLIFGLSILLTDCGFQLRGSGGTTIPDAWKSMYLATGNPNSELSYAVKISFTTNGVVWASERSEAVYVLRLGPEKFQQRNLSLNSQARASELELTLTAEFSVMDTEGNEVLASSEAIVVEQMENDPRNVVGKAEEINILKIEMRNELARQVMRRISFYAASTQSRNP